MSRGDGFEVADVAAHLLDDDKVRKLWRRLGDQGAMCEALVVHEATLLASWGAGDRLSVEEAIPIWLRPAESTIEALVAVGLLDAGHRITRRSWRGWFGPAFARREERREAGRRGGLAKAARTSVEAPPERSSSGATSSAVAPLYPSVPSYPSGPSSSRAPARARGGGSQATERPTTIAAALAGTPFLAEHSKRGGAK